LKDSTILIIAAGFLAVIAAAGYFLIKAMDKATKTVAAIPGQTAQAAVNMECQTISAPATFLDKLMGVNRPRLIQNCKPRETAPEVKEEPRQSGTQVKSIVSFTDGGGSLNPWGMKLGEVEQQINQDKFTPDQLSSMGCTELRQKYDAKMATRARYDTMSLEYLNATKEASELINEIHRRGC
jgi:uncharacterized protein (UPF0333 family)